MVAHCVASLPVYDISYTTERVSNGTESATIARDFLVSKVVRILSPQPALWIFVYKRQELAVNQERERIAV